MIVSACTGEKEHTAAAVNDEDSVAMMVTRGVNTLISDSGVVKYRLVAELWEVNQARDPSRWVFDKGLFMEQFDEKFHTEMYIQADTAYYFDQQRLWELRGRVRVRTVDGLRFASEELYWDQVKREFYSNLFSRVITPERELEGTYFRSDENMYCYTVSNSAGSFVKTDADGDEVSDTTFTDTIVTEQRQRTMPKAKIH